MDILINVVLPVSLAIIMLSLGVGLEFSDFARVLRRKKAFVIGAISQIILIPVAAFIVVSIFALPSAISAGIMLLSFCPGGVTSNIICKFARGDVALSVSLTALVSLFSILTMPFLAAWAIGHFMGDAAPDVSITGLAIALFLITTLPVLIGVAFRHFARGTAMRVEPGLSRVAAILFVIIVVAALASNWRLFVENVAVMGGALILLNAVLLITGLGIALAARLDWAEAKAVSVETGIQNSTLGITLAGLISGVSDGFSALALPSAVYGITMYLVVLPFIIWFRRH